MPGKLQGKNAERQIAGAVLEGGQSVGESDNRRAIAEKKSNSK
jgi:hypothetical protein